MFILSAKVFIALPIKCQRQSFLQEVQGKVQFLLTFQLIQTLSLFCHVFLTFVLTITRFRGI